MSRHAIVGSGSLSGAVSARARLYDISEPGAGAPTLVSVSSLTPADSPRLQGVDAAHVAALTEVDGLPPILVQRSTMRVIDGMHRLDAARSRSQEKVYVQFVDCGEGEAFLLAVAANIKHGLPLTLADRRAAAGRIIRLRPDASDRWVAEAAGLANKTVAAIRRDAGDSVPSPIRRVGRDGRVRPLNPSEGRRLASEILASNPSTPLHLVARDAGISVGTVRDVREKLRQGIDPVTPKRRATLGKSEASLARTRQSGYEVDFRPILQQLRQDPSLCYTESGRTVLRWLRPPRLTRSSDWEGIVDCIPPHCTFDVIRIARSCAAAWSALAEALDQRNDEADQAQVSGGQ